MQITFHYILFAFVLMLLSMRLTAQDSTVNVDKKVVTLKEVVVRSNLNVPAFIDRVKDDSTFYKAFRNLKILGYSALNDIQIFDKKGKPKASLRSRTKQQVANGCRWMSVLSEETKGDMYNSKKEYNYYTMEMYAGLFFAMDTICGESNVVGSTEFRLRGKSGMEKHKEQLKMLFFNPGSRIPGIPFIGNKIAVFDEEMAALYDFVIDMQPLNGEMCYQFRVVPRADLSRREKNDIVINEMTTWFRTDSWEIVARNYDLSYRAGVYDFDVHVEVEMTKFAGYLVPKVLRYNGNWDAAFKKREKAVFTATLFDYTIN
jgi:hypothetical protein